MRAWFNKIIKPKFFEVDHDKKSSWRKQNPLRYKTNCCICDFPIDPHAKNGWFDQVVNSEHIFFRNIYSLSHLKTMGIDDIGEYKENFYRLLNNFTDFEDALQNGEPNEEVINFIGEDLSSVYNTFSCLKEDIEKVSLSKKTLC